MEEMGGLEGGRKEPKNRRGEKGIEESIKESKYSGKEERNRRQEIGVNEKVERRREVRDRLKETQQGKTSRTRNEIAKQRG